MTLGRPRQHGSALRRESPDSVVRNDMIDLPETRLIAIVHARVLIWLLFLGAALTLGMVG